MPRIKIVDLPKYQEDGQVKKKNKNLVPHGAFLLNYNPLEEARQEALDYSNQWYNSPMYKQHFEEMLSPGEEGMSDDRMEQLRKANEDVIWGYGRGPYLGETTFRSGNAKRISLNPIHHKNSAMQSMGQTGAHEVGHVVSNNGKLIPKKVYELMKGYLPTDYNLPEGYDRKSKGFKNLEYLHDYYLGKTPGEFNMNNADEFGQLIKTAKMQAQEASIGYDPFTQEFTPEMYDKYLEYDKNGKYKNSSFNLLRTLGLSKDAIVDLFNRSVAKNDGSQQLNQAKYGGIPKYQEFGLVNPRDLARQNMGASESIFIQEQQKQDAIAEQMHRRKAAASKRQFISQGQSSTPYSESRRKELNKQYIFGLPNASYNEETGDVSRVNPNRSVTGESENFMSRREDKAMEHIGKSLEYAGYLEGLGVLGKAGFNALKNSLLKSTEEIFPGTSGFTAGSDSKSYIWKNELDAEGNTTGKLIAWNKEKNMTMQDEYIENLKKYYDSPAFKEKMEKYYPDVDVEMYKQKTLENLQEPMFFSREPSSVNAGGFYTPKRSSDAIYIPGHTPTFKQKILNANTNPDWKVMTSNKNSGKSLIEVMDAGPHELSHQRTNGNELLPDWLTKKELQDNVRAELTADELSSGQYNFNDYYSKPTEFDVRAKQLKEDLKNAGIIDYFKTNEFTPEHITKLQELEHNPQSFKDFNEAYRKWKNKEISSAEYNAAKFKYENTKNPTLSTESKDLIKYWTPEYLAQALKLLPATVPAVIGAAALQNKKQGVLAKFQNGGEPNVKDYPDYRTYKAAWDKWMASQSTPDVEGYTDAPSPVQDPVSEVKKSVSVPSTAPSVKQSYTGQSIIDYLKSRGYSSDRQFRSDLAQKYGVQSYMDNTGFISGQKNLELLSDIRSNDDILEQINPTYTPVTPPKETPINNKGVTTPKALPVVQDKSETLNPGVLNLMFNTDLKVPTPFEKPATFPQYKSVTGSGKKVVITSAPQSKNGLAGFTSLTAKGKNLDNWKTPKVEQLPIVTTPWEVNPLNPLSGIKNTITTPVTTTKTPLQSSMGVGEALANNRLVSSTKASNPPTKKMTPQEKLMEERKKGEASYKGSPGEKIDNAIKSLYENSAWGNIIGAAFGDEKASKKLNERYEELKNKISNIKDDVYSNVVLPVAKQVSPEFAYNVSSAKHRGDLKDNPNLKETKTNLTIPSGNNQFTTPPIVTGDTIPVNYNPKNISSIKDRYIIPGQIDLNNTTWGVRNRGDYRPIETQGGDITLFNDLVPAKTYFKNNPDSKDTDSFIGLDKNGRVLTGTKKDFENTDIPISHTFSNKIVSFPRDKNGKLQLVQASKKASSKHLSPITETLDDNGKVIKGSINLLVPKGNKDTKSFGEITGGRVVFVSPDGKDKRLAMGSPEDIAKVFDDMKKKGNYPYLTAFINDNGTYGPGLRKKGNVITSEDLKKYQGANTTGSVFLYLKDKNQTSKPSLKYKDVNAYTPNIRTEKDSSYIKGHPLVNEQSAIVLHHTGYSDTSGISKGQSKAMKGVMDQFSKPGESSHVVIDFDGTRYNYAKPSQVTFHAGKSILGGRENVNDFGIGIEFQGDTSNKPLTDSQIESFVEYIAPIIKEKNIPLENIITHKQIRTDYMKAHPEDKQVQGKPDVNERDYKRIIDALKKKGIYPQTKKLTRKKEGGNIISREGYINDTPPEGYNYRIPSDSLFNPTPYTIKAVSDNGIVKTLSPYDTNPVQFPGAQYVDEFHQGQDEDALRNFYENQVKQKSGKNQTNSMVNREKKVKLDYKLKYKID